MANKVNRVQIPYVFKPTFGAALDSRFSISKLSNLVVELPIEMRYAGQIVYIEDIKSYFTFKNGVSDADFKPFNQYDIITIPTITDVTSIDQSSRFVGQMVFVSSAKQMYIFDTGVTNNDLHLFKNVDIKVISSIDNLTSDIPNSVRYIGQLVYITNISTLFTFKSGINNADLKPVNQNDICVIQSYDQIASIPIAKRYIGQMVYIVNEQVYYSFANGIMDADLRALTTNNIVVLSVLENISSIPQNRRFIGQMVYITSEQMLYIFKAGLTDADLKPYNNIDIKSIPNIGSIVNIKPSQRYVGQIIYVVDRKAFLTFRNGITDQDLTPFSNFDIITIPTYNGETGIQSIITERRYVGQMVYIVDEHIMYVFNNGILNSDLTPLRNADVKTITFAATNLNSTLFPVRQRFVGQVVYSTVDNAFYTFVQDTNSLKPLISGNTCVISSLANLETELPQPRRYIGQFVYVTNINMMYIFRNDTTTLYPFNKNNDIISISTTNQILTIPNDKRFVGQLVYISSLKMFYIFKDGVENANCVPLNQIDIISIPTKTTNLSVNLPTERRYVGQIVYVIDEKTHYTFKNGILDTNLVPFQQIDIKVINSISNIDSIPMNIRYVGMIIFISELNSYFTFIDGIDNSNIAPLKSNNTITIDNISSIVNVPSYNRFIGQIVYVTSSNMLYTFRGGITDNDVVPLNKTDILSVNTLEELAVIPQEKQYLGQLVYVKNSDVFYICRLQNSALTYVPYRGIDIISINQKSDINSISNERRFEGQLIYVSNENMFYTFVGGINVVNLIPLMSKLFTVVETYNDILSISVNSRFIGQIIYCKEDKMFYSFKNDIYDNSLTAFEKSYTISSLSNIESELPMRMRFYGQMVWIKDAKQLRIFDNELSLTVDYLVPIHNDVVSTLSISDYDNLISNETRRPPIVIKQHEKVIQVFRTTSNKYVNIHSNSIITGLNKDALLASLSNDITDEERVVGRLYYSIEEGIHYTFIDGILNTNFKPIHSDYILSSLSSLDSIIPITKRRVGLKFYVVDEEEWYYFSTLETYKRQNGFTIINDVISISGDYEYVHNLNVNECIIKAFNSRNQPVDIVYKNGYLNESVHTEAENIFARKNIISLSSDVSELLTLRILAI